jgi:hypothetical protein
VAPTDQRESIAVIGIPPSNTFYAKQEAQMNSVRTLPLQRFSAFGLIAEAFWDLSARLQGGLAAMYRHRCECRPPASRDNVRNRKDHGPSSRTGSSFHPGSVMPRDLFDPLYAGLSANAACLDTAISRRR